MSSGLTPKFVMQEIKSGKTQAQIARENGVSRQYVSHLAKRGGYKNPYTTAQENLPWEVDRAFAEDTIWKQVRRHGVLMTTGTLGEADRLHLRAFYRKLIGFNVVVDYDPHYPPIPGISNRGGFAYVPRTEADEDFIVKIRPGTRITRIGDRIWRMPSDSTIS